MAVRFLKLEIKDFRQIKSQEWRFEDKQNYIYGMNGSGKTNSLHAITWCLFGKDLADRSKFEAVPLNPDNSSTELEPDVTLTLKIGKHVHELRRQLKAGKTAQTFIDRAPCKTLKEFEAFVSEVFQSPERFKIFTNPLYFAEALHWKDQRQQFMQFFPLPSPEEVVTHILNNTANKEKALRDSLSDVLKGKRPEGELDRLKLLQKDLEEERTGIRSKIELLDEQLEGQHSLDATKLTEERDAIKRKLILGSEERQIIEEENAKIRQRKRELEQELQSLQADGGHALDQAKAAHSRELVSAEHSIKYHEQLRADLAEQYKTAKLIDTTCGHCGQTLPEDKLSEIEQRMTKKRQTIAQEGKEVAEKLKEARARLEALEANPPKEEPVDEVKIKELQAQIHALPVEKPVPIFDEKLRDRYEELNKALARSDVHKENQARRAELSNRLLNINREFEKAQVQIMDLGDFFHFRSEMIVQKVNSHFKKISVKVLEIQKNGTSKETFEILKDGVPYSELNTAGQLEAGLELSGFLKEQLDVDCPVIIDNGERYTDVALEAIPGQLICAIAQKDSELRIESK